MPLSEKNEVLRPETLFEQIFDRYYGVIWACSYLPLSFILDYFFTDSQWWWAIVILMVPPALFGIFQGILDEINRSSESKDPASPLFESEHERVMSERTFIRKGFIQYVVPTVIIVETIRFQTGLLEQLSGWVGLICFFWGATFIGTFIWTIPDEVGKDKYQPEFIIPTEDEGDTNSPLDPD